MSGSALLGVASLSKVLRSACGGISAPVILDASCHLASTGRLVKDEFCNGPRIAQAKLWDINEIAAKDDRGLPHMLPTTGQMAAACSRAGVLSADQMVVVYDTVGVYSAARLWWQFVVFGHRNTHVLQGGLPAWIRESGAIETGIIERSSDRIVTDVAVDAPAAWVRAPIVTAVRTLAEMVEFGTDHASIYPDESLSHRSVPVIATGQGGRVEDVGDVAAGASAASRATTMVVDARSSARFTGTGPEPRPGLPSGHIPGSVNVPFTDLLACAEADFVAASQSLDAAMAHNVKMQEGVALRAEFERRGVSPARPGAIVTTCGSGVTAAVLTLALHEAGRRAGEGEDASEAVTACADGLFDGSWAEYAQAHAATA